MDTMTPDRLGEPATIWRYGSDFDVIMREGRPFNDPTWIELRALPAADFDALLALADLVDAYCEVSEIDTGGTAAEEAYDAMKAALWKVLGREGDPNAWRGA